MAGGTRVCLVAGFLFFRLLRDNHPPVYRPLEMGFPFLSFIGGRTCTGRQGEVPGGRRRRRRWVVAGRLTCYVFSGACA